MTCNVNPYSAMDDPNYVSPNMNNYMGTNCNMTTPADQNISYITTDPWDGQIGADTQNSNYPVPVQPNGDGTSFITTEQMDDMSANLMESLYTPEYLRRHIGYLMRVEFLIGNCTTDRMGYLRDVGANYIVLESVGINNYVMCDLLSIKFVTILGSPSDPEVASLYQNR